MSNDAPLLYCAWFLVGIIVVVVLYILWKTPACQCVCLMNGIFTEKSKTQEETDSIADNMCAIRTDANDLYLEHTSSQNTCFVCLTGFGAVDDIDSIYLPSSRRVYFGVLDRTNYQRMFDIITGFSMVFINQTCPICLDAFARGMHVVILKCNHVYHEACLVRWLLQETEGRSNSSCPLCKEKLTVQNLTVGKKLPFDSQNTCRLFSFNYGAI